MNNFADSSPRHLLKEMAESISYQKGKIQYILVHGRGRKNNFIFDVVRHIEVGRLPLANAGRTWWPLFLLFSARMFNNFPTGKILK